MREKYKTLSTPNLLETGSSVANPVFDQRNLYDTVEQIKRWILSATRSRETDIRDYKNQISSNPVIYSAPSSSSDLSGTEKVGDIAADASYFYIVVDNAGTLAWRRVAISSF